MDLRDLTYFETIAELGHLGRAAEKLNRSQPALTKSIQRLEESFGTRLFQRDGRRIKLTPVGELLQARGKELQQSIAQTQREVRDFASGMVGNIRVGCAATMAEYLMPKLTSALLQRTPDVTFKLVIGQDDLLRESLRSGQLDMIICGLVPDSDDMTSFAVFEDEAVVIASKRHPIFKTSLQMSDLCAYRWVLPPASVSSRKWLDAAFAAHGLPLPTVQIEANSISLLPGLIAQSNLLSFIARESLEFGKTMQHLREVTLEQTTMKRTIGVTLRKGGYLSPAAEGMLQMLRDNGGDFLGWV
ncbi:LysR family transcriptional regulator [Pseudomonas syringae]|uniref:LysR family transcriptional regulator n=3 Tax=Pseudomonas syringae TaxID=317 RepID=A0A9Q4FJ08_PSESX|nr:LysR family transcriptional regulator [Pseudomonas syringae]MCF5466898.1 LysR family transcriptional regulator [Pseudomonas syringae]MCF5471780.1 LysR family transcriptional regulator [Pseudomonas syringae]MCF5482757.1 LysR family transcriptional regulator [Pseudomonas syringae]MCF5488967.1 LysR family transcriptional regulator [Pseudomonas syringae]MCF5493446.1 LysR family transcriptional regulator [Pseudomonas syringae]